MHPLAHHDVAGLSDALQPGGEIHRLAYSAFLDTGDNHQAGRDADAHCEMAEVGNLEVGENFDDLQSCMNGPLGLTFVRQRITEERDDAIAQTLEDVSFITGNAYCARILID